MRGARRFYQTCLDTTAIDSAGAEPFLALLQKVRASVLVNVNVLLNVLSWFS